MPFLVANELRARIHLGSVSRLVLSQLTSNFLLAQVKVKDDMANVPFFPLQPRCGYLISCLGIPSRICLWLRLIMWILKDCWHLGGSSREISSMTATCPLFNLFFLIVLLFLRVFRNIVGSLSGLTYWNNISRVCMCTNVMRLHTKHAIIEIISNFLPTIPPLPLQLKCIHREQLHTHIHHSHG